MSVGDRIKELRESKGWSQARLAKEVTKRGGKLSQQNVANIEAGIVKKPKALIELADAFGVLAPWLQTGKGVKHKGDVTMDAQGDLPDDSSLPGRRERQLADAIPITGEVAAGQWLDLDVEMDPRDFEQFPIAADPAYPLDAQYGLIVRGNSMNRVFSSGEVLHCLDVWKAPIEAEEDDIVIVERIRAQASQREVTAKRITKRGKLIVLSPDSTEVKWKPIEFNPKDGHDGDEEVRVVAVVLATYRPIRKRK